MSKVTVNLGRSIQKHLVNENKLAAKASLIAESLILPAGVEFAVFEHRGMTYALSARISIDVDHVPGRVPNIVIPQGGLKLKKRRVTAAG